MKRNRQLLLILSLLTCIVVVFEIRLTWQQQALTSDNKNFQRQQYLNPHRPGQTLRRLLEDREIKELPVQISTNCSLDQLHQTLLSSDIICINETRLWEELTQHGVKINQLSLLQAKTAIVSAVLEELKSRQNLAKVLTRQQYVNERLRVLNHGDTGDLVDASKHNGIQAQDSLSFYDHAVASFRKEAKSKPSDYAIPNLDSFYERGLPPEKQKFEESDDFNGLFPIEDRPRKKKVKRPFSPLIMEDDPVDDLIIKWDNPRNNKWKKSHIPGIPPMPDRPPVLSEIYSPNADYHPDLPKFRSGNAISPSARPKSPGIPPMPRMPPNSLPETTKSLHNRTKRSSLNGLSDDLLQLRSFKFQENFDLIMRKLPTRFKYDGIRIKDRLKYIERAVNATDPVLRDVVHLSLNPDILERAKFQQQQIHEFCSENPDIKQELPSNSDELSTLFQHLLYDDSRRIVFCYVPKNGCSNMKRMMLVLNGILPPESAQQKRPPEVVLKQVHSFRNLTKTEAIYKLNNYYKFAIVRNPLERLLSAYRNKLETPLKFSLRRNFPERLKAYILKKFRREEFEDWIADEIAHNTTDIHPNFSEFLKFMTKFSLNRYNEHFKPALQLCFPCAVHYDLFLNFKMLEYDTFALMQFLDIPFEYYPESIAHKSAPTGGYLEKYFKDVDIDMKVKLFHAFKDELEFYYTLHPEEWGMHHDL